MVEVVEVGMFEVVGEVKVAVIVEVLERVAKMTVEEEASSLVRFPWQPPWRLLQLLLSGAPLLGCFRPSLSSARLPDQPPSSLAVLYVLSLV